MEGVYDKAAKDLYTIMHNEIFFRGLSHVAYGWDAYVNYINSKFGE